MSLNDSMTLTERSKLAVWDYPISDRFILKIYNVLIELQYFK
jgi:hypothetical protein